MHKRCPSSWLSACLLVAAAWGAAAGPGCKGLDAIHIPVEDPTYNYTAVSMDLLSSQGAAAGIALEAGQLADLAPTCVLGGAVDECCNCTYQAVDALNQGFVNPLLTQLVRTPFFRYFKVNIWCDCPLWPDDSMCSLRACSVCECSSEEVPLPWLVAEGGCDSAKCAAEQDGRVNSTVDPDTAARLLNLKGWRGWNNPWMAENEGVEEEYQYVNLLINPERYTGYAGEHAHRIWNAIYSQSCFEGVDPAAFASSPATFLSPSDSVVDAASANASAADSGSCPHEKRVFYRLISGMHASISAHISANYLLNEDTGVWGHNLTDFRHRLGSAEVADRVRNLYFAYLFVLRAVMKAGPLLARYSYNTGSPAEDTTTAALMQRLVGSAELHSSCPMPFDEGRLWKGSDGMALREELREAFVNITRIMDCVGCEKCKLWGKLQTLGVATALKVLFSSSDCSGALPASPAFSTLALERNEVIALVNLLERFSASIEYYRTLSAELQRQEGAQGNGSEGVQLPAAVGRALT